MPHPSSSSTAAAIAGSTPFPSTLVNALQSRSLTDGDYDLLLSLDHAPSDTPPQRSRIARVGGVTDERLQRSQPHGEGVAGQRSQPRTEGVAGERVTNTLHVEPLDGNHPLIVGGAYCDLCHEAYVRGDWIKKLPCKHKVR